MAAEYMHIGIPVLNRKEGMVYNEAMKFWVSNVDDYDFKIEYLKFEEGTPFPEILSKQPHVAYRVDDLDGYAKQADRIILDRSTRVREYGLAFVIWDDAIIELYEEK